MKTFPNKYLALAFLSLCPLSAQAPTSIDTNEIQFISNKDVVVSNLATHGISVERGSIEYSSYPMIYSGQCFRKCKNHKIMGVYFEMRIANDRVSITLTYDKNKIYDYGTDQSDATVGVVSPANIK